MAKLYFKYGAMNSGKTTNLLQVAHNYEQNGMKVIIIKSITDKKGEKSIVSRIGIEKKVDILLGKNENLLNYSYMFNNNIKCILVDEAQFLSEDQVTFLWKISKVLNISVICYGLRSNFQTKLFEGSKRLFELADTIEETSTICRCGKKAQFNVRYNQDGFVLEGNEVAIDGIDASYESLCGACYVSKVLKLNKLK